MLHKIARDLFMPDHFAGLERVPVWSQKAIFFLQFNRRQARLSQSNTVGSLQNQEDFGVIS